MMNFNTFHQLPDAEVAALVRAAGPGVCAFPVNGTRRWFLLEGDPGDNFAEAYLRNAFPRHFAIYRMLLEHGLDTLLLPVLGGDLMDRGKAYAAMAVEGLKRLATDPALRELCRTAGVRVRFYGDYRKHLEHTEHAHVLPHLESLTRETATYGPRRMLFGLFASDATETAAGLAVDFFRLNGRPPNRREMVDLYYGEYVDPVRIFIGFDKCSAYDMPLLATGNEDLYFTVAPSLYLTSRCLRAILYDHLFLRHAAEPDYSALSAEAIQSMRSFYHTNKEEVLGLGTLHDGLWYPQPYIEDSFQETHHAV
jgi:adenosine tuberculosinyltransferase